MKISKDINGIIGGCNNKKKASLCDLPSRECVWIYLLVGLPPLELLAPCLVVLLLGRLLL
jgi:hypothetical protein